MLKNNLRVVKATFGMVAIGFPVLWSFISIYMIIGSDGTTTTNLSISIIGGLFGYGYFLFRYFAEKRALENYICALESQQFNDALTYGRMYYAIKRNGLKGAGGEGLTQHDEQCITNDISAYKQ